MARVFLTGGGGFIGGQLARALVDRGDEVVALARSEDSARGLAALGATVVRGDVLDRRAVGDAIAGAQVVHHVAGLNSHCPRDPGRLWQVNVLGPQTVIHAAARAGVARVVFTSSSASLGEPHGAVGDETTTHRGSFLSLYEQSKYEGERAAFLAGEVTGAEVVALNPTSVQGPPRRGGNGAIIIAYLNRRLRVFVEADLSIVDVRDVVAAHLAAETRGAPGARYVLSQASITSGEAVQLFAELSGVRYRVRFASPGTARRVAAALDAGFRLRRRPSPVCPARVNTILHGHRYDGSLAQRELGIAYTPVRETFRRTIEWARAEGLAPTVWRSSVRDAGSL
jgi:dihydroflavonol-4-reductase